MSKIPAMIMWMQSLSEPTRARLLRLLDRAELTVAELCTVLQLPQSTVSRHLKVLSDEGWIVGRREGSSNLYRMIANGVDPAQRKLWNVVRSQSVLESTGDQDDARFEKVLEERRSKSQTFFSTSAEKWDRLRIELFGSRIDAWTLGASLARNLTVGDLGCGTGAMSQSIAPWVHKVIAVDSSSAMLQAAKKRLRDRPSVELRKGELSRLPIEDDSLDLSLMTLVLAYVDNPSEAFAEARRVTRRNGRLIILDMQPHDRSEYREQMGHVWQGFSEQHIRAWLEQAGFDEIRYEPVPPDTDAKGTGLFLATGEVAKKIKN